MLLETSLSFVCESGFIDLGSGTGEAAEDLATVLVELEGTSGTEGVSEVLFSFCFGASTGAFGLGTGDGVECFIVSVF